MIATTDPPEDVLSAYYEALSAGQADGISRFFDRTATFITLAGSADVTGAAAIDDLFRSLCETWLANGLSTRIGHDRSQFESVEIQANARLVRTRLTNFTQDGKTHHAWNCTYVLCNGGDGWKITLATSDNPTTARAALPQIQAGSAGPG